MDIKMRNLDDVAIKKVDELAKQKGMSRNQFLKAYIEKIMWQNVSQEECFRLEELFHASLIALEKMNDQLSNIEKNTRNIKALMEQI